MKTADSIPQAKVARPLPAGQGHASGFRENHPRRRLRYFRKTCTAGVPDLWSLWNEIPSSRIINYNEEYHGLESAEVAVTTQHLIDMGQEKDNLLQMSDFGDMGNSCAPAPNCFPKRKLRNTGTRKWEEIPDLLINQEWLCPNFFEIREAMEQLEEPDKDCFFDWCDRYGHDISTEDPHLLVAHYIELYGNAAYIDDEPLPGQRG